MGPPAYAFADLKLNCSNDFLKIGCKMRIKIEERSKIITLVLRPLHRTAACKYAVQNMQNIEVVCGRRIFVGRSDR